MYRNVSLDAHLAALLFLGAAFLLLMLMLAALVLYFCRRQWVRYSLSAAVGPGDCILRNAAWLLGL